MEECDYCGATFDDGEAHLRHLRDEHYDELGRIDRRRVEDLEGDGVNVDPGPVVIALVVGVAAAVVAYVVFFVGGSSGSVDAAQTPYGQAHEHGTMEVVILGEQVDFSQSKYQVSSTGNTNFHFENGDGRVWHAHARGVTVEYALATLDIQVTGDSVTFEGTTYSEPDYRVNVTVDGDPVDPTSYVLGGVEDLDDAEQGDSVRVVVEEAN